MIQIVQKNLDNDTMEQTKELHFMYHVVKSQVFVESVLNEIK